MKRIEILKDTSQRNIFIDLQLERLSLLKGNNFKIIIEENIESNDVYLCINHVLADGASITNL